MSPINILHKLKLKSFVQIKKHFTTKYPNSNFTVKLGKFVILDSLKKNTDKQLLTMGIEPMIIDNKDIQTVLDDFVIFDHIQRNKKYAVVVASDGLPIKKPVIWEYVRTNIDDYFVERNNKKRYDDDLSVAYFAPLESSNNNNGNS
jgi:hypothetical protein